MSANSYGLSTGFAFQGGFFQHNIISLTKDRTGKADFIGDTYLPLGLRYSFEVGAESRFSPSLHLTHITSILLPKKTPEDGATKNLIFLNLPYVTNLIGSIDGKIGLGYFQYEIKGEGGTVQLSNGTGTSTFYHPSETRTSRNIYLMFGFDLPREGWELNLDFLVNAPASDDRRSYNMYLYATYPFTALFSDL